MAENVNKLYSGITDAQMLEETQTILDLFVSYQAEFAVFDASLNAAFAADLQAKIDAGIDFPTDDTVQNEISELTDAVNQAWEACKAHFQDAKYFIEKAFPGNTARHKVFGFGDYTEMSRSQSKVLPFMDQFGDTAAEHGAALIAAGYTLEKIEEIPTLAAAFNEANRAQEMAKKVRLDLTQGRTITMKAVWTGIKTINIASKSVYRNNYARLQQFLMPAPASNEAPEALSLRGTIINTATNLPEPEVAVSLPDLGLATATDLTGSYGFAAGTPAGATTLNAVKSGFADYSTSVVLVEDDTVVKNIQVTPD